MLTQENTQKRRILASAKRIAEIMAAGIENGLTATGVSHYPDGRLVVHFGGGEDAQQNTQLTGWENFS